MNGPTRPFADLHETVLPISRRHRVQEFLVKIPDFLNELMAGMGMVELPAVTAQTNSPCPDEVYPIDDLRSPTRDR